MLRPVAVGLAFLVLAAVCAVAITRPASVHRDAPRALPWELPDYRNANTSWSIGPDGRIYTEVEHFFLEGITPAMLAWFYQHLPISTVDVAGRTLPLYHIFHPSEHGQIRVIKGPPSGEAGMVQGALIERIEWFGRYDSQGRAEIISMSDAGMVAKPTVMGLTIGEVRHIFSARDGGSAYKVYSVVGSELPVIGSAINFYLRRFVFHPEMLEEWRRHQVEEVASLQFFLADIYAQRDSGNHFTLQ